MAATTFLYDDACPMCKGYTGLFTTLKWSNRKAFSQVSADDHPGLDLDRGRHEIPLLDAETGTVRYGLDAMTMVIGRALPIISPLVRHPLTIAALKPLYWLITYNRRVIAGTKAPATGFDCAPDFHAGWRFTYLGMTAVAVLLLGFSCTPLLIAFGLALVAGLLLHQDRITFLGHFATVLLMCALVLTILPSAINVPVAYVLAAAEGWRRL